MLTPGVAHETLLSKRTLQLWAVTFLTCFGIASATAGLIEALFNDPFKPFGAYYLGAALLGCCTIATVRVWPRKSFSRYFPIPGTTITIVVGDLFDQDGHLIIGMNDTFDTDTGSVIAPHSIQGQMLAREYGGDVTWLDEEVEKALRDVPPTHVESRTDRPRGKLARYPVGTVAVIGERHRRFFCVAYSTTDNGHVVHSSLDDLWRSLSEIWKAIRLYGERRTVSVSVLGTGLARISNLPPGDLIRLILISYMAASREAVIADQLRLVIHPPLAANLNLQEIEDFLSAQ
ncbi:macro domain-containing protein [Actinomadura sp. 3N508]|uniref:macro domain-containing protein n=1 Tax=Actinomadura sp. 3N508 TaxID=3375153 RepID=UPI0037A403DF